MSWLVALSTLLLFSAVHSHWNYVEGENEETTVLEENGTYWREQAKLRLKTIISHEYDPDNGKEERSTPFVHALRLFGILSAFTNLVLIFILFDEEYDEMDMSSDVDDKMLLQIVDSPKRVVTRAVKGVEMKEEPVKETKKEEKRRLSKEDHHLKKKTKRERKKSSTKRRRKLSREELQLRTAEENSEKRLATSRELELELTPKDKTPTKSVDVTEREEIVRTRESRQHPLVRRVASRIPKSMVMTEKPLTAKIPTPKASKAEPRSSRLPRAPKGNQTKFLTDMENFFDEEEEMEKKEEEMERQKTEVLVTVASKKTEAPPPASPEKSEKKKEPQQQPQEEEEQTAEERDRRQNSN